MFARQVSYVGSLLALAGCASLANREPLVSDRPGFSESTAVVDAGRVQVESGQRFSRDGDTRASTSGEVLVRRGLAPWAELRVAGNSYRLETTRGLRQRGFEDASVGVKLRVDQGPDHPSWRPALSLLAQTTVPTGTAAFRSTRLQPAVGLLADWSLADRVGFSGNLVVARPFDGLRSSTEFSGIGALEFAVHPRVGAFVEAFGLAPIRGARIATRYIDGGVLFPITPDLQLDIHAGFRPSEGARDVFMGVGIAVRR